MISLPDKYKVGKTWVFVLTRTAIDLTGQTIRSMFRNNSVDGDVLATLVDSAGINTVPAEGQVTLTVSAEQTAVFPPNARIFFDVKMTDDDGFVWQSETYRFTTEQGVTRGGE